MGEPVAGRLLLGSQHKDHQENLPSFRTPNVIKTQKGSLDGLEPKDPRKLDYRTEFMWRIYWGREGLQNVPLDIKAEKKGGMREEGERWKR